MENNSSKCCFSKLILAAIPVFIFLFAADFLVHGIWLKEIYQQTPTLWRTEEEMKNYGAYCLGFHALLALIITALFRKCKQSCSPADADGKKPCPIKGGLCFGIKIGLFMGVLHAFAYIYMPISGELAVKWFLSGMLNGVGSGLVLALVFSRCKS